MAKYLDLARAVIEEREGAASADTTIFHLNGKQCTRLWLNLRATHDYFSLTLAYLQPTAWPKFLQILKEFFIIVTRADAIAQQFTSERSWLQASVFQGDHRQAFKELTLDLQACVELFQGTTRSLCYMLISNSDTISIQADVDMDDAYQMDMKSLRTELQELSTKPLAGEAEKFLVEYLIEREKSASSTDSEEENIPQFYTVNSGYPTSIEEHIGRGAFGVVYKVNWMGMPCAKKHFDHSAKDENLMKEFMKEVSVLATLNHPHIVKLLCSRSGTSEVSFVMELMPMSLSDFIKERWNSPCKLGASEPFAVLAAIDMMLQIARGIEYLHDQDIVHRDLKSSNILVSPAADEKLREEGYADVKLTDFGLAKMKVPDFTKPTREKMGTTYWRAPEAFQATEMINWKKADAYSFAMTCSEILTGEEPFSSGPSSRLYSRITSGERPVLPSSCPKDLAALLESCWKTKPRVRPSFSVIRENLTSIKRRLLSGLEPDQRARLKKNPTQRRSRKSSPPTNVLRCASPAPLQTAMNA